MSVLTKVDKDELVAAEDSANVSVKIREKKTVDLVLATGTEDTQIANRYADKIEEIKTSLEKLGYSVNVGATKSTHYTAKDTFAWQEYDHIDYIEPDKYYAKYNIPKHILYENDGIRMIGYCIEANKDFLYLEGNNETKKVLEFDVHKEESKYVVNKKGNKATDLVFTGTLYDGSTYTKRFDHLYEGEQIDFTIPQNMTKLVVGQDAPVLKNITLTYSDALVKNNYKNQIDGVKEVIRIVAADTNETVYTKETDLDLDAFGQKTSNDNLVAVNDFSYAENGEYCIYHEVVLQDGRIIALEGDGFILDTEKKPDLNKIFGDGALISLSNDTSVNGIELNGAILTIGGTMHLNTNIAANTSILNISSVCESVLPMAFNAMVTNITNGTRVCSAIEAPVIEDRLDDKDIYIESPVYDNYKPEGALLASNGNITIRSSYARFKGLIYAPNGTVTIESSTFNMEGRIIAKNIIYKGSVLNVSSYDGDLDLLK